MRKSFDGLCGLVASELKGNATSGDVFVFLNRQRTHIKLLHWEHGGFVLYYKRLEEGTFPASSKGQLSWADLVLMIEGVEVQKSRQLRRYQV
ncbi:IS66 family insertion sequence element accessory protein TnpB [Solitalea lacus]|nr:IS66 family insertion sequence element accessory protein TnpB [Solitalea lacus]UKJ06902.1 IS66 family insertion sequence element accessory protein TnpB [Solitalea lacus]UKJ07018.1 IS66 family insertion sequence element accessory protein TnpB [Solitalea lacus]UKJ07907.1 IS66 family insertion sequence element accessory protein TnpB [Solitalea lacus]UKJ07914.1 IS66 family insertion sequence element accessory protein TnpB [Solitalea lacus]